MSRIVIASLLVGLVSLVGCSDSNDSTGSGGSGASGGSAGSGGSTGGSGGSSGSGGAGGSTVSDAGGAIPTGTCTEPGSICVNLKFPTATEVPTRLIVGLYKAPLPPLAPPDVTAALIEKPDITAGGEISMKMTGLQFEDVEYDVYAALYMPGGGSFQTKKGIDYEAFTSKKVTFSKTAPNTLADKLEFSLAK